jgi:hypothetical protein
MRMLLPVGLIVAASLSFTAGSALAKSEIQKECSEKYQAAKAANQLNGQTWNQFYKQCAAAAKAEPAPTSSGTATAAPAPTPAPPAAHAPSTSTAGAVFPSAVSSEFSKESAGKARMHTCLAQYKANKTTGGNGGLKWIQKGGGYYSECNKRLKG